MLVLIKRLFTILLVLILFSALYVVGLITNIVPLSMTPQVLANGPYTDLKHDLERDSTASTKTSEISKSVLDFFNTVESDYAKKTAPAPTQVTDPSKPADVPPSNTSPIDKAHEAVQQYNDSLQEQKKTLDSL